MTPAEQHSRREFLRQATTSIGLVLSAPVIASIVASCEQDEKLPTTPGETFTVDITTLPELAVVGGITTAAVTGLNSNNPVFISRIAQNTFAVFSVVCTHAGCFVDPPATAGANCRCACHGSEYSPQNGHVVVQPTIGSATNLPSFASSFDPSNNILTITG